VAAGSPGSVNDVADTIGRILGKPVDKRFEPPRPGDIRDSWADITAARETLGFEPLVGPGWRHRAYPPSIERLHHPRTLVIPHPGHSAPLSF